MTAKFVKIESYIYSHFSTELKQCRKVRRLACTLIGFDHNLDRKQTNMYMYFKTFINTFLLGTYPIITPIQ